MEEKTVGEITGNEGEGWNKGGRADLNPPPRML